MRRVFSLLFVGVFVLLGSAAQAQAQIINLTAVMSGQFETPGVLTGAVGTCTASVDLATQVVTYRVDVFNMPVGTTAGHIHVGAVGQNGPTIVNFTIQTNISNDFAILGTAGPASLTVRAAQGINSWEDFIQGLILGNTYCNVHSTNNPGGEIRGQLVVKP